MSKGKKKKHKLRILIALEGKAELSKNKGIFDRGRRRRPTPKQRRHRPWKYPWVPPGSMKYSEMIENAFEPLPYYDVWEEFRDGMRDTTDRTKIIPRPTGKYGWWGYSKEEIKERNAKLKKQVKIKEAMRESKRK